MLARSKEFNENVYVIYDDDVITTASQIKYVKSEEKAPIYTLGSVNPMLSSLESLRVYGQIKFSSFEYDNFIDSILDDKIKFDVTITDNPLESSKKDIIVKNIEILNTTEYDEFYLCIYVADYLKNNNELFEWNWNISNNFDY